MTTQATVFKSGGTCSDTSLPKLYRDTAIAADTLFCYDALDTYSWPTQAAPVGAASWIDLADVANATFAAVTTGWSDGFVFDSADQDLLTLPTTSKRAGDQQLGLAVWLKFATTAAGSRGIIDMSDGATATSQYAVYRDGSNIVLRADATSSGTQAITASVVYQLGITIELSGSTYTSKLWLNGAVVKTVTSSSPLCIPSKTTCTIGQIPAISANGDDFTLYRVHGCDLSDRTGAEFIAADYASGVGRFS